MSRKPPKWVTEEIAKWQKVLHLEGWRISAGIERFDRSPLAMVDVIPDIWVANILFDESIPKKATGDRDGLWHETIIHELLHIVTGRLGYFVEEDVLGQLGTQAREVASSTFRRELEPVIEQLARIMAELKKGREGNGSA